MPTEFHFRLPDWPPQRLVREAVMACNLRHLEEKPLDFDSSPWPLIRGALLAFLRHQHSLYNERLRARCEYDKDFRDTLAAQIAAAAFRKYPWLGQDDPRPFPEPVSQPELPMDEISSRLADLHSHRDQLLSALRDLRRESACKAMLDALQSEIEEVTADIDRAYNFLSMPKIKSSSDGGGLVRAIVRVHEADQLGEYVFYATKQPSPNHLKYLGFHCSRCGASVMRLKQTVAFGQGFERMVVQSCHCMFLAVMCPKDGPGRLRPLTREIWQKYLEETSDERQATQD